MKPVVTIAVVAFLQQPAAPPPAASGQPCSPSTVVGTWQFVERTAGPKPDLDGLTAYKHITPSHFVVTRVTADGVLQSAHGGPHAFSGGKFTETVEFHSDHPRYANVKRGSSIAFDCSIDGERLQIAGTFSGQAFAERWRRVGAHSH